VRRILLWVLPMCVSYYYRNCALALHWRDRAMELQSFSTVLSWWHEIMYPVVLYASIWKCQQ
jgi:hypothetical protein